MNAGDIILLIFEVLGGLALFIFGMNIMSEGLRRVAGRRLRTILAKATDNPLLGIGLGTFIGFLIQSSATTVMIVGFINAGLMSLVESIPPILGANIGTSLSMQMISFKLGKYCYFAIASGFLMKLVCRGRLRHLGRALIGFGFLFLGMNVMSGAVKPHREALTPLLSRVDGSTLPGMLLGVVVSLTVTGIIQSSGATIGMCFALIQAGVFTRLSQVYPLVLGAHIGTCATALLGSIGTHIEARRAAVAHLFFNLFNVTMAIIASPLLLRLIPLTSRDLTHQTANLHTIVMVVASAMVLPFHRHFARLVTLAVPSRRAPPEPSYLEEELIPYPEKAVCAVLRELQRVMKVCMRSFALCAELFFRINRRSVRVIEANEQIVNEVKALLRDYLTRVTGRKLSRRQAILVQHLSRCVDDVERIGDHVKSVAAILIDQKRRPLAAFDRKSLDQVFELYEQAVVVCRLVIRSLDPGRADFQEMARRILEERDLYMKASIAARMTVTGRLAGKEVTPLSGIYFTALVGELDRVVRHAKAIALAEQEPVFWIKREKLDKMAAEAAPYTPPPLVKPDDFLDRLQREDYL